MNKKRKIKQSSILPVIMLFIFISLLIIIGLEYIDFKKGKDSFIFNDIFQLNKKKDLENKKSPILKSSFSTNLLNIFFSNNVPVEYFKDKKNTYHVNVHTPPHQRDKIIQEITHLTKKEDRIFQLSEIIKKNVQTISSYKIYQGSQETHTILFYTPIKISTSPIKKDKKIIYKGRLAFIIDDIGYAGDVSMQLRNLNIPITASIIPSALNAKSEASRLKKLKIESMIHIPMQSENNSQGAINWDFISSTSTSTEIRLILQKATEIIPYAKGINNHMGSLITHNTKTITSFLNIVKDSGLFFIDSRTSEKSQAYQIAQVLNIKSSKRDVFIDHIQEYKYTLNQIKKLVNIAIKNGQAIGIGHPFQSTFRAIKDSIPLIRSKKVQIVFVSSFFR